MRRVLWSMFAFVLLISSCDRQTNTEDEELVQAAPSRTIYTHSVKDIEEAFDAIDYALGSWDSDRVVVPRVYLTDISSRWGQQAKRLPVKTKKSIFFQMILPLVLRSNEELLETRGRLIELARKKQLDAKESRWLHALAQEYDVFEVEEKVDAKVIDELLLRVNIIPPSLALAQAAKESGWGTSRFSMMGNSLFGQWDLSGQGMAPAQQRKGLGTYGLASFETPLHAVMSYMKNLNTHSAYSRFRSLRASLATKGELRGLDLVTALDRYSEQGEAYVDELRLMIEYNHLAKTDLTRLSDGETVYITPIRDPEHIEKKRMQRLLEAAKSSKSKTVVESSPSIHPVHQRDTNSTTDPDALETDVNETGASGVSEHPVVDGSTRDETVAQVSSSMKAFEAEEPQPRLMMDWEHDTTERIPWEWESNTTVVPWSVSE